MRKVLVHMHVHRKLTLRRTEATGPPHSTRPHQTRRRRARLWDRRCGTSPPQQRVNRVEERKLLPESETLWGRGLAEPGISTLYPWTRDATVRGGRGD